MAPRIATVVHGRFYAFDLVRALLQRNVSATLFTNYPAGIVEKFGIGRANVRSNAVHGVASRAFARLHSMGVAPDPDPMLHPMFSRWSARALGREGRFDAVQCFSGVAEELFRSLGDAGPLRILIRGSAHITAQNQLLEEEQARAGRRIDKPSTWSIAREIREYELADVILVLSSFARRTFESCGIPADRLFVLPLGADLSRFRASAQVLADREARIRGAKRLRVLTTGNFSYQKGALDLANVARALHGRFDFRFVGSVLSETASLARQLEGCIEFVPRQHEFELPAQYAWADVFLFPTIQDGYAAVLSHAQANGLPIVATTNCAAPDLVSEGATGWVVPIRRADLIQEVLVACDEDRGRLAGVAARTLEDFKPRDWSDVAADLEGFVRSRARSRTAA